MAQVALIGASGNGGSRILKELVSRGHSVTAIARHPEKIEALEGVTAKKGDVYDKAGLTELLKGHDAVISAVYFSASDPQILIDAVRDAGVKRYLVMGGAGSLFVGGTRVVDTPDFPDEYKPEARKGVTFLELLQKVDDLDWTFISPSAEIFPGARTAHFRKGKDELLIGDEGSKITFEDFAVAMVNELEVPEHVKARFTVGY